MNETEIRALFLNCDDVVFEKMTRGSSQNADSLLLFYCEGLIDTKQIHELVYPQLIRLLNQRGRITQSSVEKALALPTQPDHSLETSTIIERVFEGNFMILVESLGQIFSINMSQHPKRTPDEPNTEISIRGPKDGFIEAISVNTALIRRRLKTNSLRFEQFYIGKRSKTRVGLMYIDDVINPLIVDNIRNRLQQIDIDSLTTTTMLEEFLVRRSFSLYPLVSYTGRPDYAVNSLLNGRCILIVDGSPTVLIAPVNFTFLLSTAEDAHSFFYYVWLERLLRFIGFVIAVLLPGFWVALMTFHQDQLPFNLLATMVLSRQGVPLAAPLEALLIIVLFELFKEAGLRLPLAVGQTLSVVGGLIIGQAAISAGLASAVMLVVIAASTVSTFTFTSQSLVGAMSITRLFVLILSSGLGMFGFLLSLFTLITYLANLRSFGVPYMAPLSPYLRGDFLRAIVLLPAKWQNKRPKFLKPIDRNRQGG